METAEGGSTVAFDPYTQHSRPALTLANGTVYIAYAASCPDEPGAFHGWVFGYDAGSFTPKVFLTTPNGDEGGIWILATDWAPTPAATSILPRQRRLRHSECSSHRPW